MKNKTNRKLNATCRSDANTNFNMVNPQATQQRKRFSSNLKILFVILGVFILFNNVNYTFSQQSHSTTQQQPESYITEVDDFSYDYLPQLSLSNSNTELTVNLFSFPSKKAKIPYCLFVSIKNRSFSIYVMSYQTFKQSQMKKSRLK